jgi:hypothetical protein
MAAGGRGYPDPFLLACAPELGTLTVLTTVWPRLVMETLGRSQIGLAMNTYSHVIPDLKRETAERMDAILGS